MTPKDLYNDRIRRVASFVNGLSPWNLHRGEEAIRELLQDAQKRARIDELGQLQAFLKSAHLYDQDSAMKLRYHFDNRLAELQHPKDDKQDGLEAEK